MIDDLLGLLGLVGRLLRVLGSITLIGTGWFLFIEGNDRVMGVIGVFFVGFGLTTLGAALDSRQ